LRSFDLSEFPPDLADEIRERSAAGHVPPGEVVAELVRLGLSHPNARPATGVIDPRWLPSPVVLETGEVAAPFDIPRTPGVPCTNIREVDHWPISNLILWEELEVPR
jgi:hypothetical protein